MTTWLHNQKIGQQVKMKGPCGLFTYNGHGCCTYVGHERKAKHINLIAGGTGITPMLQVIKVNYSSNPAPANGSPSQTSFAQCTHTWCFHS